MSSKINVEVHRIGNAIHFSRICFLRTPIFEKDLCFPKAETCLNKQPDLVLKNSGECQHCGRPYTRVDVEETGEPSDQINFKSCPWSLVIAFIRPPAR